MGSLAASLPEFLLVGKVFTLLEPIDLLRMEMTCRRVQSLVSGNRRRLRRLTDRRVSIAWERGRFIQFGSGDARLLRFVVGVEDEGGEEEEEPVKKRRRRQGERKAVELRAARRDRGPAFTCTARRDAFPSDTVALLGALSWLIRRLLQRLRVDWISLLAAENEDFYVFAKLFSPLSDMRVELSSVDTSRFPDAPCVKRGPSVEAIGAVLATLRPTVFRFTGQPSKSLPRAFFAHPVVRQLQRLEIDGNGVLAELDDATLLDWTDIHDLLFRNARTRVSLAGFRRLVRQWHRGERPRLQQISVSCMTDADALFSAFDVLDFLFADLDWRVSERGAEVLSQAGRQQATAYAAGCEGARHWQISLRVEDAVGVSL